LKLKNKKLIIFDLDGTLINSAPDLALAVNHTLSSLGRDTFSQKEIDGWVGNGASVLIRRALSASVDIDKSLDEELSTKALDIFLDFYSRNSCVDTITYPLVPDTLTTLKDRGFRLALVTNKPFDFIAPILKGLKLDSYFELCLGGDSLSQRKPHPEPLLYVCDKLEVDISNAVMVGDSKNDILSAKACGMQSIGVTYGYNYDEPISSYEPDVILDEFVEILDILEESL